MRHRTTLNEIYSMFNRLGYNTQLLNESRYNVKQGRHAISYMKQHGISDPAKQEQLLDSIMQAFGIQRTDEPRFNYILGLTRLSLDGQLQDVNDINELKTSLNYIADGGHGNYDENLNGLSTDELINRFRQIAEEDDKKSRSEVAALGLGEQSTNGYEIVPITSEAQAEEYYRFHGGLGDDFWCITHGSYETYELDGTNQCYFCLKDGFENLMAPQDKSQAPFDEFGLSMISVIVDYKGSPTYITTRWNHGPKGNKINGENNPELCTAAQVSQLIGVDFYSVFKPNEKGVGLQRRLREYQQMLDSGMALEDVFDYVEALDGGAVKVKLGGKYNLVVDGRVVYKQWFTYCGNFCDGLAKVQNSEGKWSYIRTDGKFIGGGDTTNLWFNGCGDFHNGLARVLNSEIQWSYIRTDGKFIDGGDTTNLWFNGCGDFREGLAQVRNSEIQWSYIRTDGKFIDGGDTTNLWFNGCGDFREGLAQVRNSEGKWSFIRTDGKFIDGGDTTNLWFNGCGDFREGLVGVQNNAGEWSYLRSDGKFIDGGDTTNLWFRNSSYFICGFARVQTREGEWIYIDQEGNLYDLNGNLIQQVSESRIDRIIRNVLNEMKIR